MLDPRYKNVSSFSDRHGKLRYRYRKGNITVSLPGNPGDAEFEYAYQRALGGKFKRKSNGTIHMSIHAIEERRRSFLDQYLAPALRRAQVRAIRQHVAFGLTPQDVASLLDAQDWKCAVSGIDLIITNISNSRTQQAFKPSIDRIVPADGYVLGNVRIVCQIVNFAMNNWGEEPLVAMAKAVVANRET